MSVFTVFWISLVPGLIAGIASALYVRRKPSAATIRVVQAIGSGVLLAVVCTQLAPRFVRTGAWGGWIAFAAGVALMLGVRAATPSGSKGKSQIAFIVAFMIEFFINGALIGITSVIGFKTLLLVAISMCFCATTCSLSIVSRLTEVGFSKLRTAAWLTLIVVLLPIGAVGAHLAADALRGKDLTVAVGVGAGALLYLALIELFLEAYEGGANYAKTIALFGGFWTILFFAVLL